MHADVIVLGAGIVGVCTAIHLQDRGLKVALIDRRAPGEETSFGNAGLIERSAVVPYGFPQDLRTVLQYARNHSSSLRYQPAALPAMTPWLLRYWRESRPNRLAKAAADMLPLIENSVAEHDALIERAGMQHLVRDAGWLEAYRTPALFAEEAAKASKLAEQHGLKMQILTGEQLRALEPSINECFVGALHWLDPKTVSDPGALVAGYAALFVREGGTLVQGDALTLMREGLSWQVSTEAGVINAPRAVVALGPWSTELTAQYGYHVPLLGKRGYHMHYRLGATPLVIPVVDLEEGYVLTPMRGGLRLTTGVELAAKGAAPNPAQLDQSEQKAREVFDFGPRTDMQPWMGRRPCTPDMRPLMGPAPRHEGLWFAFGHNHHGLTLGPVCGRLLAQMMTGETPLTDPRPYSPARFA
ncbi:NAD(P)/FAD-dependent oxidoreductase [Silvimonas iriomotensis]|uniref:FAD-dependent oxidoreductase n=1 Tax=Silvimonas iriomotensis TaxID=449662 RepID=A0ABQ2P3V2_9NEIS|nr:FAD-binding oxidoreductase [Silvimonas iriomotensis]GGP17575.1 FAD-dependent oxidoreductase [Silvimonas iriomotensis]